MSPPVMLGSRGEPNSNPTDLSPIFWEYKTLLWSGVIPTTATRSITVGMTVIWRLSSKKRRVLEFHFTKSVTTVQRGVWRNFHKILNVWIQFKFPVSELSRSTPQTACPMRPSMYYLINRIKIYPVSYRNKFKNK